MEYERFWNVSFKSKKYLMQMTETPAKCESRVLSCIFITVENLELTKQISAHRNLLGYFYNEFLPLDDMFQLTVITGDCIQILLRRKNQ